MRLVPIAQISAVGKLCVGLIASAAGLVQIPEVKNAVIPLAANHPHVSTLLGALTIIGALMANPQVQTILHIEQQTKIPLDGGGTATVNTDTTAKVD